MSSCFREGGSPDISGNVGTENRDVSAAVAAVANTIATQTDASAAGQTWGKSKSY